MLKRSIEQFFLDNFDIPLEGILDIPNAQFIGNNCLNIDGCIGIKKYEENEIIIKCKRFILTITGASLSMLTFSHGRVSIRGEISCYKIEVVWWEYLLKKQLNLRKSTLLKL